MKEVKKHIDVKQSADLQTRPTTIRETMAEQVPIRISRNIRRGHIIKGARDTNHMQWKLWEENVAETLRMMENQHLDSANRNYNAFDRVQRLLYDVRVSKEELQSTVEELETTNEKLQFVNEELERTSRHLWSLMNTMLDILMVTDPEGIITEVNRATERISGYSREELIGQPFYKIFTEPERAQAGIKQVLAMDGMSNSELTVVTKDGQEVPVSYNAVVLRDPDELITNLLFSAHDVTGLKQAETALRTINVYNRKLIEASVDPLMVIDLEGRITDVNSATEIHTGYSREHLIGTNFSNYFTKPEEAKAGYMQAFQEGLVYDYELEIRHKDGHVTPVVYNASVYRDESGNVIGLFAAIRDVAKQKKAEEILIFAAAQDVTKRKKAEEILNIRNQALKSSISAFAMIDLEGKMTYANTSFLKFWGYDKEDEVIGKAIPELLESEDESMKIVTALREKGRWQGETLAKRKDGSNFTAEIYANIVFEEKGNPICIAASFVDITGRIQAEETLRKTMMKLESSNKELEQFAYVASHDLQEPLRKIFAFGDRLKTKYTEALADEGRDYLERMQDAATRMQALIDSLLSYSRITSKAQPFVPVNLATIVQEVIVDLEEHIQRTGGRVEAGDMPTIDADPTQMRQLLQNLIGNGLKFHEKERAPVVKVYAELLGETCQIIVEDNGIGFDEKYLDRIFTVFQRLHSRSEFEGTGIGLAICRRISEHHDGSITAKSTLGQGAMFIVTLPVRQLKEEIRSG